MLLLILGCQNKAKDETKAAAATPTPEAASDAKREVNVAQIIGQNAERVDELLGKPVEVTPTGPNQDWKGEFRDYAADGISKLQIKFKDGKATEIVLVTTEERQKYSAEQFARQFGVEVNLGEQAGTAAVVWKGVFNGINFREIKAIKGNERAYETLMVKVD